MKVWVQRLVWFGVLFAVSSARAFLTPTFIWSTGTPSTDFATGGNWTNNLDGFTGSPVVDSALIFRSSSQSSVVLSSPTSVSSITFENLPIDPFTPFPDYAFSGSGSLSIGAGG